MRQDFTEHETRTFHNDSKCYNKSNGHNIGWLFLLNIVVTILGHYFVEINRCYANRIHNHINKFSNHKSSVTKNKKKIKIKKNQIQLE